MISTTYQNIVETRKIAREYLGNPMVTGYNSTIRVYHYVSRSGLKVLIQEKRKVPDRERGVEVCGVQI